MRKITWPKPNMDRLTRPWTKAVEDFIQEFLDFKTRQETQGVNANKAQSSSARLQARTIAAQPYVTTGYDSSTGFGLTSDWSTVATVNIVHPEGFSYLSVAANGNAAAVDTTSGGLTVCEARILIAEIESPIFSPAKDAGVSAVNNILTPSFGLTRLDVTTTGFTSCILQLKPLNPSAFPSRPRNYATLTVVASFTK